MCPGDVEFVTVNSMRMCPCRLECLSAIIARVCSVCGGADEFSAPQSGRVAEMRAYQTTRSNRDNIYVIMFAVHTKRFAVRRLFDVLTIFRMHTFREYVVE